MKEDKYINTISEASYKQNIRTTSSTDSTLAWFEEDREVYPRVDASKIWQDYQYVPETPYLDKDEYSVSVRGVVLPIYKRITKMELLPVKGTRAAFDNKEFCNIIIRDGYRVELFDGDGEKIPFGLNKWVYDPNNGYLSFLDGFPKGYNNTKVFVSFYKYVGRNFLESVINTDGSLQMQDSYVPTEDQDVATKIYVDSKITNTDEIVNKLIPPVPDTFENKDLEIVCDTLFESRDLDTGDICKNTTLVDEKVSFITPRFYNPGEGVITILLDNLEFLHIPLENIDEFTSPFVKVLYSGDSYETSLNSRNFYKSLQLEILLTTSQLIRDDKYVSVKLVYRGKEQFYSNAFLLGLETTPTKGDLVKVPHLNALNSTWKYISGVPTPLNDCTFLLNDFSVKTLNKFTKGTRVANVSYYSSSTDILPTVPSSSFYNEPVNIEIKVPDNYYSERFYFTTKVYNIFNEESYSQDFSFPFRVDTVSDESERVTSGEKDSGYGLDFDSEKSIADTNELQLINGKYVWPILDFSGNGQYEDFIFNPSEPLWIKAGPDYSNVSKEGIRYATFKYEIPYSNGVYISVPGLSQDPTLKNYNVESFEIKVDGQTEWLDCSKPYSGIGLVRKSSDGTLAISNSYKGTIYCTFGPEPIKGTLFVRIGKTSYQEDFTKPVIQPNI